MPTWLKTILGIDPQPYVEGGKPHVEWLALPSGDVTLLLIVLAVAILVGLWWLYRIEAGRLPAWVRASFIALRVIVIAAIAVMLLEPVIVFTKQDKVPAKLLVLMDTSSSMALKDAWGDRAAAAAVAESFGIEDVDRLRDLRRIDLAHDALMQKLLAPLEAGGKRKVEVYTFAERLGSPPPALGGGAAAAVELASDSPGDGGGADAPADNSAAPEPAGGLTAIGQSMREAMLAHAGPDLAGMLVITDGRSNAGTLPDRVAQYAKDTGVLISAVAVGTTEGPRNLALTGLDSGDVVFVRDRNTLTAYVEANGAAADTAYLDVEVRRDEGVWEDNYFERKVIDLEPGKQRYEVTFEFEEQNPVRLTFRGRVRLAGGGEAGAPELTMADNVKVEQVRVVPQQLKVLLIAGSSFPEVQFLKNTLYRDKKIILSSWIQTADKDYDHLGNEPIRRLPTTIKELNDNYDAVILFDPDPAGWPSGFGQMLVEFVGTYGGGLVFVAGERNTAALFDAADQPELAFLKVLPVVREPGLFRSAMQMSLSREEPWRLALTEWGKEDEIFKFHPTPEINNRVLDALPGMFWHFPVSRPKIGATVLARHGDPRMTNERNERDVLLATHLVGPGRTFFIGFDSTYRWRYLDEDLFDGFWARVVDRAGRNKRLGGVYPFRLETGTGPFAPGDQIEVRATFRDADQIDAALDLMHGEVEAADQPPFPITLVPDPGNELTYVSRFTAESPGPHLVRVWPGDQSIRDLAKPANLSVDVTQPDPEKENPTLDLATLISFTAPTGGSVFTLDQLDAVPGAFPRLQVDNTVVDSEELWDAPVLWTLIFLALLAEWVLRKKCRLV